jgi:hypothetical protein
MAIKVEPKTRLEVRRNWQVLKAANPTSGICGNAATFGQSRRNFGIWKLEHPTTGINPAPKTDVEEARNFRIMAGE